MDIGAMELAVSASEELIRRSGGDPNAASRPPAYKAVGLTLAISSGLFIGTSFVLKKVGLLKANVKYNEEAGEGYGYLKNAYWWTGMTLMIVGEICNFVAYAFVDAILVTPLGALSVVVTTILSAIFLKERLSFVGKIGCFICIIGSIVIVLNAPEQSSVTNIQQMQGFIVAPGFLSYAGVIILGCAFVAFWVGPRYGKKTMLVYLTVCSLIGGLSVVATQGLGAAVVAQAGGTPQFNQWFLYVLFVFVIATLVTEIIYLNKALNLYNAALVTPTYYVYFTSSTIVASSVLFRGFKGTPISIATIIMGFLVICAGVILLQLSKSAKDVPDTAVLKGDLDQIRTVGEQEQPESEPKADAIRGTAALIRRFSQSRQKWENDEARRVYEEKMKDQMEPISENEVVEWDGLRRRKTVLEPGTVSIQRRKTLHPPLGLTKFPSYDEDEADTHRGHDQPEPHHDRTPNSFLHSFRRRQGSNSNRITINPVAFSPRPQEHSPIPEAELITVSGDKGLDNGEATELQTRNVLGLPSALRTRENSANSSRVSSGGSPGKSIMWAPDAGGSKRSQPPPSPRPHTAGSSGRRQFSFQRVFHRHREDPADPADEDGAVARSGAPSPPGSAPGAGASAGSRLRGRGLRAQRADDGSTEEERLGLVKGDSNQGANAGLSAAESPASDGRSGLSPVRSISETALPHSSAGGSTSLVGPAPPEQSSPADADLARYEAHRQRWSGSSPELTSPPGGSVPTEGEPKASHSSREDTGGGAFL